MGRLDALEELLGTNSCSPACVCMELAAIFDVRPTEIGLLRVEGQFLRFVHPAELQAAGSIPLSSSAIAARTAVSKLPELFNQFVTVPHHDVFEKVRLHESEPAPETPQTIQKLMSAPILDDCNETIGVVQVSRKGATPSAAGPDFTLHDLDTLEGVARRVAYLLPELLATNARATSRKLEFMNSSKKRKLA